MSNSIFRKDGTAQGVAKQRLIESLAKPENRVIYNPYAENFVLGSRIIKIMGHKLYVWLTKKYLYTICILKILNKCQVKENNS